MGSYMSHFVKSVLKMWVTKYTVFANLKEVFVISSRKQTSKTIMIWYSNRINNIFSEYTPAHFSVLHLAKSSPSTSV